MPATPISNDETEDTLAPLRPNRSHGKDVRVRVTKLGDGKISTGQHIPARGDVMAKRGDILTLPKSVADQLENRGLAEIQ